MSHTLDWLTLTFTPGLGSTTLKRLVDHFGSARAILAAVPQALSENVRIRKEVVNALLKKSALARAEQEIEKTGMAGVTILTWDDANYPALLREIADPPMVLYVKGATEALSKPGIGIVGARAASSYGLRVADTFARDLARLDIGVTSGFALGIDTAAHKAALATGGTTVAVLGCGLDINYPQQNAKLGQMIVETGAMVSEYPLGTIPEGFRFPARNRIISGLSMGVLVVEAAKRSGSLITATQALEQGREVFAVPGRVDSMKSEGCHRLLKDGAKLVHSVEDVMEELQLQLPTQPIPQGHEPAAPNRETLSEAELQIYNCLEVYPKNIEEIIAASGQTAHLASETLLHLELKGLINTLPGKQFQKVTDN